jgi:heme A synthase
MQLHGTRDSMHTTLHWWFVSRCQAPLPPLTVPLCCVQVSLGITTLMTYVPVSLGSAHQAGALTLFSVAVALLHSVRPTNPAGLARLLATSGTPVAAVGVLGIGAAVMYNN